MFSWYKYHSFWHCMSVCFDHFTLDSENAISSNGIERTSPFLFRFFLVHRLYTITGNGGLFSQKAFFCGRPKVFFDKTTQTLHDQENSIRKQFSKQIFMHKYSL